MNLTANIILRITRAIVASDTPASSSWVCNDGYFFGAYASIPAMALGPRRSRRLAIVKRELRPARLAQLEQLPDKSSQCKLEKRLLVHQEPMDGNEGLSEIEALSPEPAWQLLGLKAEDQRTRLRKRDAREDMEHCSMEDVEDGVKHGLVAQSVAVADTDGFKTISEINPADQSANVYEALSETDNSSRRPQPTLPAGSESTRLLKQHIRGGIADPRGSEPDIDHEGDKSMRPYWRETGLSINGGTRASQPDRRMSSRIGKLPSKYYGRYNRYSYRKTLPMTKSAPTLTEDVPNLHGHQNQPPSTVAHDSDSGREQDGSSVAQDPRYELNDDQNLGHNQGPSTPQNTRNISVLGRMSGSIRQWISYVRYPSPDLIDPSDMESETEPPESSPQQAWLASEGISSSPAAHFGEFEHAKESSPGEQDQVKRSGLFGIYISPVKSRRKLDRGLARALQQRGETSQAVKAG
jgi:hypothetical protein